MKTLSEIKAEILQDPDVFEAYENDLEMIEAQRRLRAYRSILAQMTPAERAAVLSDEGPEIAGDPEIDD